MKPIVKFFKVLMPCVAVLSILFSSCVKDHDYYSIGDFFVSYGVVQKRSSNLNDYIIHLDDGNNVVPATTSAPSLQVKDNERVWVYFNPLGDTKLTDSTVTYIANIVSIRDILFKDIKNISQVSDDSMGHDPINVRDAWISKANGILTLDLKFFTQRSLHYVNLIDNGEANGITNPFVLELRHNARGDLKEYPVTALVSFKLDYLKLAGKSETRFYIRYTDYDGRRIDLPQTYKY